MLFLVTFRTVFVTECHDTGSIKLLFSFYSAMDGNVAKLAGAGVGFNSAKEKG